MVSNPHRMYYPPQGRIGKSLVSLWAKELRGVRERKWNSERPLVFLAVVLRRRPGCTRSRDIKRRVEHRLALWEQGKFDALVQDATRMALISAGSGLRTVDPESKARAYNSKVLDGKVSAAVRSGIFVDTAKEQQ